MNEKPKTGDFLKELHLTEGRNTGFKKNIGCSGGKRITKVRPMMIEAIL
jgi:hypothetical protein